MTRPEPRQPAWDISSDITAPEELAPLDEMSPPSTSPPARRPTQAAARFRPVVVVGNDSVPSSLPDGDSMMA